MLEDHPAVVQASEADDGTILQQQLVRERGRRIKAAVELGLARSSAPGRQWGRALGRRSLVVLPPTTKDAAAAVLDDDRRTLYSKKVTSSPARGDEEEDDGDGEEQEGEEEVVEAKVALLRQLVPGGEDMEMEGLLEETADYIAALKAQLGVMRAIACMLSGAAIDGLPEKDVHVTPEK